MKLTYKHYAYLLIEVTRGVSERRLTSVLDKYYTLLLSSNVSHLLPKITHCFSQLYNQEFNILSVNLTSAAQLDKGTVNKISHFLQENLECQEVEINAAVDPMLIGGIKIRYGDTIMDLSVKKQIESLKTQIIS